MRCQRHVGEMAEHYCDISAMAYLVARRASGARTHSCDLAVSRPASQRISIIRSTLSDGSSVFPAVRQSTVIRLLAASYGSLTTPSLRMSALRLRRTRTSWSDSALRRPCLPRRQDLTFQLRPWRASDADCWAVGGVIALRVRYWRRAISGEATPNRRRLGSESSWRAIYQSPIVFTPDGVDTA